MQEEGDADELRDEDEDEDDGVDDEETRRTVFFFFFVITLGLGVEWYKSLWALNTSPPRKRFTFLRSSCSRAR